MFITVSKVLLLLGVNILFCFSFNTSIDIVVFFSLLMSLLGRHCDDMFSL